MTCGRITAVLDENFPDRAVELARSSLPEGVRLETLPEFCDRAAAGAGLEGADDHDLILELGAFGAHILVTGDDSMLSLPAVLVAIERSRLSVVVIESLGHDALRSVGALLLWMPDVLARLDVSEPQIFKWKPRQTSRPNPPAHYLDRAARHAHRSVGELRDEARRILGPTRGTPRHVRRDRRRP